MSAPTPTVEFWSCRTCASGLTVWCREPWRMSTTAIALPPRRHRHTHVATPWPPRGHHVAVPMPPCTNHIATTSPLRLSRNARPECRHQHQIAAARPPPQGPHPTAPAWRPSRRRLGERRGRHPRRTQRFRSGRSRPPPPIRDCRTSVPPRQTTKLQSTWPTAWRPRGQPNATARQPHRHHVASRSEPQRQTRAPASAWPQLQCHREATTTSPSHCHRVATISHSHCHRVATTSPSHCHRVAIASPPRCHRVATTSPSHGHRIALPSPQRGHHITIPLPPRGNDLAIPLPQRGHHIAVPMPTARHSPSATQPLRLRRGVVWAEPWRNGDCAEAAAAALYLVLPVRSPCHDECDHHWC